ncbi:hypothetical protein HUG17_10141 [Dermatophagoides farinae]|nr:uncharacterized protein LOC124498041 isoform X1 [Dermatophagoides farinae]KAH7643450.1 hypothetical protein HUG17_10141 [Dermatophagoides farinae]
MKDSNHNFHHSFHHSGKIISLPPSMRTTTAKITSKIEHGQDTTNEEKSITKQIQHRSSSSSSNRKKSKWQKMSQSLQATIKRFSKDIPVKMPESFLNSKTKNPKIEQQQITTTTTTVLKNRIPMIQQEQAQKQSNLKLIHPIMINDNEQSLLFTSNNNNESIGSVFTVQDKLPNEDSALQLLSIMTNNRSMNSEQQQSTMMMNSVEKEKTEIFVPGKGHLKSGLYDDEHL